jgi:uncharacterized protein involved in response to NO
MLFGYTTAIVAGFLFTAVRNWTGQPTPTGPTLVGLALLWVAGRILAATSFEAAVIALNAAFPVAVAAAIAIPLIRSGNRRNYFFVALVAALALALWRCTCRASACCPGRNAPACRSASIS